MLLLETFIKIVCGNFFTQCDTLLPGVYLSKIKANQKQFLMFLASITKATIFSLIHKNLHNLHPFYYSNFLSLPTQLPLQPHWNDHRLLPPPLHYFSCFIKNLPFLYFTAICRKVLSSSYKSPTLLQDKAHQEFIAQPLFPKYVPSCIYSNTVCT